MFPQAEGAQGDGCSHAGQDTHLELPYHRAVQPGPFLVEFEGLAEVLQALEGWHSLQLTVIHLWEGTEDPAGGGSWPGPGQRGPFLGWGGWRDPWGSPPAWPFPEASVPVCWPPPGLSPSLSSPCSQGPANLQGVIVFVLVLQGLGSVSCGPEQLAPPVYFLVIFVLAGRGGILALGKGHGGFLCPYPSLSCPGLLLISRG